MTTQEQICVHCGHTGPDVSLHAEERDPRPAPTFTFQCDDVGACWTRENEQARTTGAKP